MQDVRLGRGGLDVSRICLGHGWAIAGSASGRCAARTGATRFRSAKHGLALPAAPLLTEKRP
jgi:hypothetical protein